MGITGAIKRNPAVQITRPLLAVPESERLALCREITQAHEVFTAAIRTGNKNYCRELHCKSRDALEIGRHDEHLRLYRKRAKWFLDGSKLDPNRIEPRLVLVKADTLEEDLFRLARHTWSIPFSKGYGRRLRFLVVDDYHEAVIGIIGMQSPPADLACREDLFTFPLKRKLELINQTMDVYSLGAIPPYSFLLGGKLVAGLVSSNEVRIAYWRQYASKRTLLEDKRISQPLVAATTTSAFGRSSIYNRLVYNGRKLAEPIGYTKGYGLIHLEEIYPRISKFVKACGFDVSGGFGKGPKIRWQIVTRALQLLGLPSSYLEHGLGREVFLFRFVDGLEEGMSGGDFGNPLNMAADEYADYWKHRWLKPRMQTNQSWQNFSSQSLFENRFS